jgi:hypothetical protein
MTETDNLFSTYLHEFAVWTSARAVQRNFTTTKIIKQAIENAGIREFAKDFQSCSMSESSFDEKHTELANKLIDSFNNLALLENLKIEKEGKITYGRMAKIIAIYLKTSVVIPNQGKGELTKVLHPPIDAILLKALHKKPESQSLKLNKITWTKLNESEYFELINKLRKTFILDYFWELEQYWEAG